MLFIIKINLTTGGIPAQLVVHQIFKRRKLCHKQITDKGGSHLCRSSHITGGLLIQFENDIWAEACGPAKLISASSGIISGGEHNEGHFPKSLQGYSELLCFQVGAFLDIFIRKPVRSQLCVNFKMLGRSQ